MYLKFNRLITSIIFFISLAALSVSAAEVPLNAEKQCTFNGIVFADAQKLVKNLQKALRKNDQKAALNLIGYPLNVNFPAPQGKITTKKISNAKNLAQEFNAIFTKLVKERILKADANDIFCNAQGAMINNGVVWMQISDQKVLKVMVINEINANAG